MHNMSKTKVKSNYAPFPKPIALLGVMVEGKPNFMNVAWFNRAHMDPNLWMISLNKFHYTVKGIKENKTLSINLPSAELVKKLDYCGLVSGRDVDKSELFTIFYGDSKETPMIKECLVNVELSIDEIIEVKDQYLFVAKVQNIYANAEILTDGEMDLEKYHPILFIKANPEGFYYALGEQIGKAWHVGKALK
ncbi:MAG: flavin reductase family protein [Candidatus Lokiarchaeota archaeon]|nr:flavin reductase family protein [Candidatus Lokiarchaeota archaeon]